MTTNFLPGVSGVTTRFALQIMLGAAFGAGQILRPQAASFPMADSRSADPAPATPDADAGEAAPEFIGPGWG